MAYIICMLLICGLAGTASFLVKKRIEEMIPLTISGIILLLYMFALIDQLQAGLFALIALSICCIIYCIVNLLNNNRKWYREKILTPGLLALLFIMGFIWIYTRNLYLTEWDNFSHWGVVVKQMFARNQLSIGFPTEIRFPEYPPATALFQYFFVKIESFMPGRGFNESYLIRAMATQIFALSIPLFRNLKWNDFKGKNSFWTFLRFGTIFFGILIIITLAPLIYNTSIYYQLYVDGILGIYFAYMLWQYFSQRKFSRYMFISLSITCGVLTLVKEAGMIIALIALIIIFVDILLSRRIEFIEYIKGASSKIIYCNLAVVVLVPLILMLLKVSWSRAILTAGITEKFNLSGITISGIIELITGKALEYKYTAIYSFINRYKSCILIPFMPLIIAAISVIYLCKEKKSKRRWLIMVAALACGHLIFAVSQCILYIFIFAPVEAVNLASYDRYMSIYFIGSSLTLVWIFIERYILSHRESGLPPQKIFALGIAICTAVYIGPTLQLYDMIAHSSLNARNSLTAREPYAYVEKYQNIFNINNDRVFIICQHSTGYDYWVIRYNLAPVQCAPEFRWSLGNFDGSDSTYNDDMYTRDITVYEWEQELIDWGYTYVLLNNIDDEFIQSYGSIFEDPTTIKNATLYQVKPTNSGIILVPYVI